jgi:hypothetical protein
MLLHGSAEGGDGEMGIDLQEASSGSESMPAEASAVAPGLSPEGRYRNEHRTRTEDPVDGRDREHSIGAGYLVLVAREVTGLSQRRLADRDLADFVVLQEPGPFVGPTY